MQKGSLIICEYTGEWRELREGYGINGPVNGGIYVHAGDVPGCPGFIYLEEFGAPFPGTSLPPGFQRSLFREIQPPMSIPESLFNQSPEKITV